MDSALHIIKEIDAAARDNEIRRGHALDSRNEGLAGEMPGMIPEHLHAHAHAHERGQNAVNNYEEKAKLFNDILADDEAFKEISKISDAQLRTMSKEQLEAMLPLVAKNTAQLMALKNLLKGLEQEIKDKEQSDLDKAKLNPNLAQFDFKNHDELMDKLRKMQDEKDLAFETPAIQELFNSVRKTEDMKHGKKQKEREIDKHEKQHNRYMASMQEKDIDIKKQFNPLVKQELENINDRSGGKVDLDIENAMEEIDKLVEAREQEKQGKQENVVINVEEAKEKSAEAKAHLSDIILICDLDAEKINALPPKELMAALNGAISKLDPDTKEVVQEMFESFKKAANLDIVEKESKERTEAREKAEQEPKTAKDSDEPAKDKKDGIMSQLDSEGKETLKEVKETVDKTKQQSFADKETQRSTQALKQRTTDNGLSR
ncbi:MAG: hypothetical protein K0R98_2025 [Rickettsiaceae bacterium]|nr:hypothetical protein [Rickettsiaceae bacterium]